MQLSSRSRKMLNVSLIVVSTLLTVLVGVLIIGSYRWSSGTEVLRVRLDSALVSVQPKIIDFAELEGLPAPVQRYFRAVLKERQPMIAEVRIRHKGTFN